MYRRTALLLAVAALAATVAASPALAHEGNPNFRSDITTTPSGVEAQMLNYDDTLELTVEPGREVLVRGYEDEPYLRFDAAGGVDVNLNSPSYYLNEDRFADVEIPARADPKAAPEWDEVGAHGRYGWHDHRVHYMAQGTPGQVEDESVETKIFDWKVPIEVDGDRATIEGTLFWAPADSGGVSPALVIGLAAAVLASLATAIFRNRRRGARAPADRPAEDEAW